MSDNIIYRWRALDYSGFCYGSNPPADLPQSADLTAFYRQPDPFRAALHEISATGNMTATPQQFSRHLQQVARDALAARAGAQESPTRGMNLGQRIAHVGGRENAQGYTEFGSPMAVGALIKQVLRDLVPAAEKPEGQS